MRSSADLYAGDPDLGEILPVPGLAPVSGAARKPENPDLLVFAVAHDFGRNLGALHHRRTGLDVFTVAGDQDAVERHLSTRLRIQQRDLDRDARFGAELAPAGRENGVGHRVGTLTGAWDWVKGARSSVHGADCSLLRAPCFVTRPRTAPSHRAPPAWPSFGIHRVSSSDRPGPRAPSRSAAPVAAGNSALAPRDRARPRGAVAPTTGALCDRPPRASASAPSAVPRLPAGTHALSRCTSGIRWSSTARATDARAAGSSRRAPAPKRRTRGSWPGHGRGACVAPGAPCPGSSASPCR